MDTNPALDKLGGFATLHLASFALKRRSRFTGFTLSLKRNWMNTGGRQRIYTLGTSTRCLEDFFAILRSYGIHAIVDVRRFPKSGTYPQFNRENLEKAALEQGFSYHWFGESLGGYRKGGYEAYKQTTAFQAGIERLDRLARDASAVAVCAERLPWKCHRMHISRSLMEKGWEVIHIIEADRTWQPKENGRGE